MASNEQDLFGKGSELEKGEAPEGARIRTQEPSHVPWLTILTPQLSTDARRTQ